MNFLEQNLISVTLFADLLIHQIKTISLSASIYFFVTFKLNLVEVLYVLLLFKHLIHRISYQLAVQVVNHLLLLGYYEVFII